MARNAGRGRRQGGRQLRPMDWSGFGWNGSIAMVPGVTAPNNCGWLISPDEIAFNYVDPTIMAIRANLSVMVLNGIEQTSSHPTGQNLNQTAAVSLGIIAWTGVPVQENVQDRSTNAPLPNPCPGPAASPELDWMLIIAIPIVPGGTAETAPAHWLSEKHGDEYYSKARRRMGNTFGLLWVVEFAQLGVSSTASIAYSWRCRYLLKE